MDVGEDGVMLGHGQVDLLILSGSLSPLLALHNPLLGSTDVSAVDIRCVLRIVLDLLCSTVSLLLDLVAEAIELMDLLLDDLPQSLLESRTHDLQHKRLEQGKQELVRGLLKLDIEVLHINVNLVDLEKVLAVRLLSGGQLHREAESRATEEDVGNTSVSDTWESFLPLNIVGNVLQIHLDTRDGCSDRVIVLIGDLLASPTEVVVYI